MSNSTIIESAEEFVRLRSSHIREEYFRAAWGIATVEIWKEVIDKYPEMREWVAHNKTIPDEIIRILALDKDSRVRHMIACKRRMPADLLPLFAKDPDETIRRIVARSSKSSREVLEMLINDEWSVVAEEARERLAKLNG